MYTSHELYCYPLKLGATKEMIAAQGLGTVLRLARKLGPVVGKSVVVVGQGQNGLIATRMMSQFLAKVVIAVDPLEYRREIALKSGAQRGLGITVAKHSRGSHHAKLGHGDS